MDKNDHPKVVIFPPAAAVIALAVGAALQYFWPLRFMEPRGFGAPPVIGTVLIVAGIGAALWATMVLRRAGTNVNPGKPTLKIVTNGPFRFSRNPMYVSLLLFLAGFGFAFSLEWVLLMVPVLWAVLHFGVILREEAYLEAKFGDDYRALLNRTRR